jgi:hypothetical protein
MLLNAAIADLPDVLASSLHIAFKPLYEVGWRLASAFLLRAALTPKPDVLAYVLAAPCSALPVVPARRLSSAVRLLPALPVAISYSFFFNQTCEFDTKTSESSLTIPTKVSIDQPG